MAAFLLGVLMLYGVKKEEQTAKYTSWLALSSPPLFLYQTIAFLETLPYRTETYGHQSCKGVCGGSILAGHIATPNEIVFLIIKKRKVEWILDKQLAILSIKPQGHYPRSFNKPMKKLPLFPHFIH